ncbi:MAG: hypothetical protein U9Q33_01175 [Campylobacterota bacterium]|nr:hypothetical protein [Campylobacterota bacterium]
MIEENKRIIYDSLLQRYNITVNKKEASEILNCSTSFLDKAIMNGTGPKYLKLGSNKNAKVVYNLLDLADYICHSTQTYY